MCVVMVRCRLGGKRGCGYRVRIMDGLCFFQWDVIVRSGVGGDSIHVDRVYMDMKSCLCCAMVRLVNLGRCIRCVCSGRECRVWKSSIRVWARLG